MYTTNSEGAPTWRRAGLLAASFLLPIGCVSDDGSPGGTNDSLDTETSGDMSATGDGDGDTDTDDSATSDDSATTDPTGDGDGDPDPTTATGDGDGDPDPTTGDTDGTDTGAEGDCGPYPEGPYKWYDNHVVPPDSAFPAMYGPDGEEVTLTMEQVHANCKEVKALAFAFGAND